MNELVCVYFVEGKKIYIYACYDKRNYDSYKVDFYDVYDENGNCLNEGDPFYNFPSWLEMVYYLKDMEQCFKNQNSETEHKK
jgi:hypothetical protein